VLECFLIKVLTLFKCQRHHRIICFKICLQNQTDGFLQGFLVEGKMVAASGTVIFCFSKSISEFTFLDFIVYC
jgi:hypothetical protein